jgi:hypothetical protein
LTAVQWSTIRSKLYSLEKLRARYTICLVHSILYRTYDWGIGNDLSFSFYFLPWLGLESCSISHLATKARTPSLTVPFWTTSKSCQGMYSLKTYQVSWSISIDLDAQYVSSFTEVFLWKTPFKHSFMLCRIILHYFRSTICHSHILIRKVVVLPLTFL